jgi:hypothetical protein
MFGEDGVLFEVLFCGGLGDDWDGMGVSVVIILVGN